MGRPKREEAAAAPEGEEVQANDNEESGAGDSRLLQFLTRQLSCVKFGMLKPNQLEGLNWMIHLAEKGLNSILADETRLGKVRGVGVAGTKTEQSLN